MAYIVPNPNLMCTKCGIIIRLANFNRHRHSRTCAYAKQIKLPDDFQTLASVNRILVFLVKNLKEEEHFLNKKDWVDYYR